jgi:acyl-coenzyme A thioesterase PaaI-like protein
MTYRKILQHFTRVSPAKLLEFYPPFWFMGAQVKSVSADYRRLHLKLPTRWYARNMHGTLFGGFMAAISDPLPALLCARIFPGTEVWTKAIQIDFKRPAKGTLDIRVEIKQSDVDAIAHALESHNKVSHEFHFDFSDSKGMTIASVKNTVYLRKSTKTPRRPD